MGRQMCRNPVAAARLHSWASAWAASAFLGGLLSGSMPSSADEGDRGTSGSAVVIVTGIEAAQEGEKQEAEGRMLEQLRLL
jgi:hypothetical protein